MRDELDEILSQQDEVIPSSGFSASVMEAVHEEADMTQPIPFPWGRAVPVLAAFAVVLVMLAMAIVQMVRMPAPVHTWTMPSVLPELQANAGWVALALLLALLSVLFPLRLASEKS